MIAGILVGDYNLHIETAPRYMFQYKDYLSTHKFQNYR